MSVGAELKPGESSRWRWFALALAVISALVCLRPGLAPFIWDEPNLVLQALEANASHRLATHGLAGSFGKHYGPVPVWVYQGILAVTHDPFALIAGHALVFAGGVAAAVFWLARSTGWWRWGGVVAVASPYVVFYARLAWDNPLNIPLGLLAVAAYASFLVAPRGWKLFLAVLLAGLTLLVHFMSLPLCLALLVHFLWRRPGRFRRHLPVALGAGLVVLGISVPYLRDFASAPFRASAVSRDARMLAFPLAGARMFSAAGLDDLFFSRAERPNLSVPTTRRAAYLHEAGAWSVAFGAAGALTGLAFAFSAVGAGQAVRWREGGVSAELLRVALLAVALHVPLHCVVAGAAQPHYYNGVAPAWLVLIWGGMDAVGRRRGLRVAAGAYVVSLAVATGLLAMRVSQTHGTRGLYYGPAIEEQVAVVRRLRAVPGGDVRALRLEVAGFETSYRVLDELLYGDSPAGDSRESVVRYRDAAPSFDASLELRRR